jgi:hypothetical protein
MIGLTKKKKKKSGDTESFPREEVEPFKKKKKKT